MLPSENKPRQTLLSNDLVRAGEEASRSAAKHRFENYHQRRSEETLRRQKSDLLLFNDFIVVVGLQPRDFFNDPNSWLGVTWGLVEAFIKWQLDEGYAVPSVNVRLSTIKIYAKLAMQAGVLSVDQYAQIKSLRGFSQKEKRRIDSNRINNRIGYKKEKPVPLTHQQVLSLKNQPNTPQGRRDRLLLCLLLDHGLRVGEVADLTVENFQNEKGLFKFYRPKVGKYQVHRLSKDTLAALKAYQDCGDIPANGSLLRRSLKNGTLGKNSLTERAITRRVHDLAMEIGIIGLSAHDCRHYWATSAARYGTDPFVLQEAGGWSSLAMPRRYVEEQIISNEGIQLNSANDNDE